MGLPPLDASCLADAVLLAAPAHHALRRRVESKLRKAHYGRQVHLEEALLRTERAVCAPSWPATKRKEVAEPANTQSRCVGKILVLLLNPAARDKLLLPRQQLAEE
eukprot:2349922-Pleurochrysis_carterae.AAC.2